MCFNVCCTFELCIQGFSTYFILCFYTIFRFEGQTQLYGCKPDDFRKAIEEAYFIENKKLNSGYREKQEECFAQSDLVEVKVADATRHHLEYFNRKKASCF